MSPRQGAVGHQFDDVFTTEELHVKELQEPSLPEQDDILVFRIVEGDNCDRHSPRNRFSQIHDLNIEMSQNCVKDMVAEAPQSPPNTFNDLYTQCVCDSATNHNSIGTRV
jgi:hypothetical protein